MKKLLISVVEKFDLIQQESGDEELFWGGVKVIEKKGEIYSTFYHVKDRIEEK